MQQETASPGLDTRRTLLDHRSQWHSENLRDWP